MDRGDANHAAARAVLTALQKRRAEPLLTNLIVAESHALLLARLGGTIARTWLLGNAWTPGRTRTGLGAYESDENNVQHARSVPPFNS
jgi:hypothetical protein